MLPEQIEWNEEDQYPEAERKYPFHQLMAQNIKEQFRKRND